MQLEQKIKEAAEKFAALVQMQLDEEESVINVNLRNLQITKVLTRSSLASAAATASVPSSQMKRRACCSICLPTT